MIYFKLVPTKGRKSFHTVICEPFEQSDLKQLVDVTVNPEFPFVVSYTYSAWVEEIAGMNNIDLYEFCNDDASSYKSHSDYFDHLKAMAEIKIEIQKKSLLCTDEVIMEGRVVPVQETQPEQGDIEKVYSKCFQRDATMNITYSTKEKKKRDTEKAREKRDIAHRKKLGNTQKSKISDFLKKKE